MTSTAHLEWKCQVKKVKEAILDKAAQVPASALSPKQILQYIQSAIRAVIAYSLNLGIYTAYDIGKKNRTVLLLVLPNRLWFCPSALLQPAVSWRHDVEGKENNNLRWWTIMELLRTTSWVVCLLMSELYLYRSATCLSWPETVFFLPASLLFLLLLLLLLLLSLSLLLQAIDWYQSSGEAHTISLHLRLYVSRDHSITIVCSPHI